MMMLYNRGCSGCDTPVPSVLFGCDTPVPSVLFVGGADVVDDEGHG